MRIFFLVILSLTCGAVAKEKNGFDLTDALVPVDEIRKGGPPRDGIPAIHYPNFVTADDVGYLTADDRVIGVEIDNQARAYPIKVLTRHEVVNDVIGDQHFVVTYCPLCGTGMVFATNMTGTDAALVFGVSGLLYNSDVLLYDYQTESLWSQIMSKAITGKMKGLALPQLTALHTTWSDWRTRHPETEVLDIEWNALRIYNVNPYKGYTKTRKLMFPVDEKSDLDIHPKERVLGVSINGERKAYPFSALRENDTTILQDSIDGTLYNIHWDKAAETAWVTDRDGNLVVSTIGYWFAWYAFFPATSVWLYSTEPPHEEP